MILNLLVGRTVIVLAGLFARGCVGQDSELYRCPNNLGNGYLKAYNGKCYIYSKEELTWNTAQEVCEGQHAHLIEVRDQATQDWVLSTLNELNWKLKGVWIGAHDPNEDHVWTWVTGDTITWSNWAPNQPSCYSTPYMCDEFCGQIRRDDAGRWHDKRCGSWMFMYSFICQYDMDPATTTTMAPTTTTTMEPTTTKRPTTTVTTTTTAPTTTTAVIPTTKSTTTTKTTTTTKVSTSSTTLTSQMTASTTTSAADQSYLDAMKKDDMSTGTLSALVIACVLGAIVFLLFAGVCFYKSRKKKKGGDGIAVHFDNLAYSVRTFMSSKTRTRGHDVNLNNQSRPVSQNEYAEIGDHAVARPQSSTKEKEPNHYSEIDDKLSVKIPKTDSDEYQKCNIAKSKLGYNDKEQYLDAYEIKRGKCDKAQYLDVYEDGPDNRDSTQYLDAYKTKPGNKEPTQYLDACGSNMYGEEECNSMNEQLEASQIRNERGDNFPNHYVDIDDSRRFESSDLPTPHLQLEQKTNAEYTTGLSSMNGTLRNFEGTLDLRKNIDGYTNNTYSYDTNA